MTITRIAMPKAQALPSTVDERLAKIRKASLAAQKKSRDLFCSLSFSFCVFIGTNGALLTDCETAIPVVDRLLTTEDQAQHETDSECCEDCLGRVLSDVLLTIVLEIADAMDCIIPNLLPALPIFIGHCARR